MSDNDLTQLLADYREGDRNAARKIFQHYAARLCELAHKNLSDRLKQRVDGEDVVQSVFRTFFKHQADGDFDIKNSEELWKLLVAITRHKVLRVAKQHGRKKRSVNLEQMSLNDQVVEIAGQEPTVEDAAILTDHVAKLLDGLDNRYSRFLELRLSGMGMTDIASEMGLSRQQVHRLNDVLKVRLNGMLGRQDHANRQQDGSS